MSSHAVPDVPSAFPNSRCPPNPIPPSSWATPVSQRRTASLEISGRLGHYRSQSSNPREIQSMLQIVLQTESQHV